MWITIVVLIDAMEQAIVHSVGLSYEVQLQVPRETVMGG